MEENCDKTLSKASSIVLATFNGVSGFLAITGNAVFLLTLIKTPALRTTSNYFVAALALADLLVGVFANSLYVALSAFITLQDVQRIKETETFLWLLTTTAVTFSLCFVAIERYFAIIYPITYPLKITKLRLMTAAAVMWIFAILFAAVSFYLTYQDLTKLWITGSFVTFLLPLAILLFCYLRIYKAARSLGELKKREIPLEPVGPDTTALGCQGNPPLPKESADSGNEIEPQVEVVTQEQLKNTKAAVTFAAISVIFAVLFFPTLVVNFMGITLKRQCHRIKLNRAWFWAVTVSYTSSAINPIIYATRMKDFRQATKKLLCRS